VAEGIDKVRIDLVGNNRKQRKRWWDGRRKRRTARSFGSTIALPEAPTRRGEPRTRRGKATADPRALERQARQRHRQRLEDPRAAADRRARRAALRGFVRRLPALLLFLGLLGGIVYTSADAQFFVYEANIQGAHYLPATTIYETAQVDKQNIFWIDPEKVARRVVALEGIKAARVSCQMPARVVIEVEERQPALMWQARNQGGDWWLDIEGRVLPYHGNAKSPDTVFVVDSSEQHLDVGQVIKPDGIARSVLQLAEALPDVRLYYYEPDRGLSFTQQAATGSWPVYVGSSENLPRKIQVMRAVTRYLKANGIQPRYLDIRWPDHPVYGLPTSVSSRGGE
jgi:cell division septal protein FtsQ